MNSLSASFTFDDEGLVFNNPMASPGMSMLAWFAHPSAAGSLYRPLTMVTYALNHLVSPHPFGYHLVNVLLHAATTLVAFELATLLLRSRPAAFATALLFAVHPVHTEAVTSVAGRAELLAGLFVLLALFGFARGLQGGGKPWHAVSLLAFGAGLFAKESAYAALPLLALTLMWLEPKTFAKRLGSLAPYLLTAIAGLLIRRIAVGSVTLVDPPPFLDNPLAYVGIAQRVETASVVLSQYLATLLLPIRLSADESFNQVALVNSLSDPRFLLAIGVLAAAVVGAIVTRHRAPAICLATAFLAAAMTVTANVAFPIGTIKAERLLYLPSFGWCVACGWLARRWCGSNLSGRHVAVAVVLVTLAGRTWIRNTDWHDNFTLFTRTVAASPQSARAHANAGAVYGNAGELKLAHWHYKAALRIYPVYAPAAIGLGRVYDLQGQTARARRWYRLAVQHDPTLGEVRERLRALDARALQTPE